MLVSYIIDFQFHKHVINPRVFADAVGKLWQTERQEFKLSFTCRQEEDFHHQPRRSHTPQFESFKLGSPSCSLVTIKQETFSFTFPFSQRPSQSQSQSHLQSHSPPLFTTSPSHHRRRSSVSTRRESAEVMGVALLTLSASNSEDNMNLGDKDSIRRRVLCFLEGKPNPDGFLPVEIPELSIPEIERRISELRMLISICSVPQLTFPVS